MVKKVKTKELFHCENAYILPLLTSSQYPWDILPRIKEYISKIIESGIDGYRMIQENVLAGENVNVHPTATIEAPAIIGAGTQIRPGAFIRGNVITGLNCVIGNSSELKNCVLLDGVQVPHYNYVGDSILGNKAHLGAGTICSNLKADGKPVTVHGENEYETGLRKVGAFLADGADIGCGCVLNPGTIIGKNTSVYPLTALRGVFPENAIIKGSDNVAQRK